MTDRYVADPDVGFIKEITKLGGADVKKCFQCATCSVACPISPEAKPFPRKEMIATSWGLKDRLLGNADIWLCHNCGDCTTRCPRGAKPGDVLAAVRAYAIAEYATPKWLAKMVQDPSKLPFLLAIPAVLILVVGLLLDMVGLHWLHFSPTGDDLWPASYFGNLLVDFIMVPTFTLAVVVFGLGLKRFLGDIHANALAEGKTDKETIDPAGFLEAIKRVVPKILKHEKFVECGENVERSTPHMMVLYGFIGLFIVTGCFFAAEWVFHLEGPYHQINPIKWIANVGGLSLVIGAALLLKNRVFDKNSISSYWDWQLVVLVLALGVTGMLTEMLRLGSLFGLSGFMYYLHLICIWCLFAYAPFSKLAHLVYRTVAMAYAEYAGRK